MSSTKETPGPEYYRQVAEDLRAAVAASLAAREASLKPGLTVLEGGKS